MKFSRSLDIRPSSRFSLSFLWGHAFMVALFMTAIWPRMKGDPAGLVLRLPRAMTSTPIEPGGEVVTLARDGRVFFNGEISSFTGIERDLSGTKRSLSRVLIRADATVAIRDLVRVWDACRQAGATSISIATTG
jgi:biopolymer transport protein ExbD